MHRGAVTEAEVAASSSAAWQWIGPRLAAPARLADPLWRRLAPSGFARYVRVGHYSAAEPALEPYAGDQLSLEGWLPAPVLARVLGAMGPTGSGRVAAAVWDGFGELPPWLARAPQWCHQGLCHHCVEVEAARVASFDLGGFTHSASLWWRADRRLCVVTPLDVAASVVATDDAALAERVAAAEGLDVEALLEG